MSKSERTRHRLKTVAKKWTPFLEVEVTDELRQAAPHLQNLWQRWTNSRFVVDLWKVPTTFGGAIQVAVARHGLLDFADWNEMERIRIEIFGPECIGVELHERGLNAGRHVRIMFILPASYELEFGTDKANAWGMDA